MDFIERFLGLSPDRGTGVTESLFFLIPVSVVAFAALLRCGRPTRTYHFLRGA